jgi:hypothetical protein
MKEFSFHDPYGKSRFYGEAVETADPEKLTKIIGICVILLKTKHISSEPDHERVMTKIHSAV